MGIKYIYLSPPPNHLGSPSASETARYAKAPSPPGSVLVAKYVLPMFSSSSSSSPTISFNHSGSYKYLISSNGRNDCDLLD